MAGEDNGQGTHLRSRLKTKVIEFRIKHCRLRSGCYGLAALASFGFHLIPVSSSTKKNTVAITP
jgi:hypothetical protein